MDIAAEFMSSIINAFEANKRLADRAVEQVPGDKLHRPLDDNTNSIVDRLPDNGWRETVAESR